MVYEDSVVEEEAVALQLAGFGEGFFEVFGVPPKR
jgi:hypothetical protein